MDITDLPRIHKKEIFCIRMHKKKIFTKTINMRFLFVQWKGIPPKFFLQILREILFPNYLTYTCANDAYSDFIYKFVGATNFIAPSKKIRGEGRLTKSCQQYKDGINSIKSSNILV